MSILISAGGLYEPVFTVVALERLRGEFLKLVASAIHSQIYPSLLLDSNKLFGENQPVSLHIAVTSVIL